MQIATVLAIRVEAEESLPPSEVPRGKDPTHVLTARSR